MDEIKIKKLIGLKIKQLRKSKKLTQFALGEIIDVDQRQIAYIEGGNSFPSLRTLNKLAKVLDCSIKDFFDYEYLEEKTNLQEEIIKKINSMDNKTLNLYYQLTLLFEQYNL